MGLLGDVYSYGDTLKRKVGGLLSDPRGTLEQFVGQLGDDMNTNISNMKTGYGFGGNKSVLSDPAQVQAAQKALADYGAQSGMSAATVWHGSPHKFDKFDSSKIGTGEGAQAYGYGLYLAESPDVAKTYAIDQRGQSAGDMAERYLKNFGNKESALQAAEARLAKVTEEFKPEFVQPYRDAVEMLRTGNIEKGGLYKVDLPDELIAKMLDWDKPLSEQKPVMAALDRAGYKPNPSMTAGEFIKSKQGEGFAEYLSEDLRKQGIPGIRYLDGGSRGAGQGSSNFVVFPGNEGLLSILERNNKALDIFKDTTWEPPLFPDTTR